MSESSICYGCNKKCILNVSDTDENKIINGNQCELGNYYKKFKDNCTKGILTTLVRIKGDNKHKVLPVKSTKPIDKSLWIECSKALSRIYVGPNMKCGDVVCTNILNTGVDIVSTKTIKRD
ncbi:DUF1667 domain-containing protein [Clostridium cadaveris]|uniref:DUF1667 domain-containing protein n=1 Tax=Clostridium cadaveris TaxID=1529 RepID=UPI0015B4CFCA|nr:DUF1667 domain-containing protein [Clostridium cadaveris]NWK12076.1 DUF1667 domain-containing protein [Clostridium cadaveris]